MLMSIRLIASLDLDLRKVRGAARLNEKLTHASPITMKLNCADAQLRNALSIPKNFIAHVPAYTVYNFMLLELRSLEADSASMKQEGSTRQGGILQQKVNWDPYLPSRPSQHSLALH
jgi:hypothetical protein